MLAAPSLALVLAAGTDVRVAPTCGVDVAEVRRIVGIELANDARPSRVDITCDGTMASVLTHEKGPVRTLDLAGTPTVARPRLLALATVELLSEPAPPPPRPPEPLIVEKAFPVPPPARPAAMFASALGRAGAGFGPTLGGRLDVEFPAAAWLILVAGSALERGTADDPTGTVTLTSAGAHATALVTKDLGQVALRAGPGARVARASLAGDPSASPAVAGATVAGWLAGPTFEAGAALALGRTRLRVGVETGLSLRTLTGRGSTGAELAADGPWLLVHLGVGRAF